jgi:exo-beta-1,3-glucanase (GH17 family)/cellulose synthase/poly-beta-1,6-N-acetylglucosamine synthase-like glycosyltransferase
MSFRLRRITHITGANILIALAIAAVTISFWALINRPEQEPAWPDRIQGFSFSPMRSGQSAVEHKLPSAKQIDKDLKLLADKTHAIRTYTVEGTLGEIPALAHKHGISVTLGGWVDADAKKSEAEIQRLIQIARDNYRDVSRIIVGNEVILRGDLSVAQLAKYLDQVRSRVAIPVSTAEPWHVWVRHPELARHVDYLAVHMLPYWEGVDVNEAVDYVVDRMKQLKKLFPNKPLVIGEVGWPSNGRTRRSAVASESNEAIFLRRFLARAAQEHYVYYVMEAFDQPWKRVTEGSVGAYWGVYNVERKPKFAFSEPIVPIPQWRLLALISVVVAGITFALLLVDSRTLRKRGRSFLAVVAFVAATAAVWIAYDYTQQYLTVSSVVVGVLLILGMIGVVVVLLAEAHEWAEALWVTDWRRAFAPVRVPDDELPMVSVHVPAYNEPPDMLIQTLNALARLDYPHYEVIVVDNNTKDPTVWKPVEEHCRRLGERFRFFHVDPLSGFKAGALNYALARTAPQASVIAVIDSDYIVDPAWLRDLAPQFVRPQTAIVQAPQDYRDADASLFKAMCYAEYRGFFYIGMITRNERNAIIQHGTMTMVRTSVLQEVGGWAEWCITEDAELGLRIFERGYEATYIPKSYGQGVMPDNYDDFKKQRFRWAYGAVQIIRRHLRLLLGLDRGRLTWGQRYHFVAGWLPWIADGFNLLFNVGALCWSVGMVVAPKSVDPPLMVFSVLPLALFIFKGGKLVYLYRTRVGATVVQTVAAAVAGLSLSHTIARAILTGFATRDRPFFRTPKMAQAHALAQALASAREETSIMSALWLAALAVAIQQGSDTPDLLFWILVLLTQSIPYLTSVGVSLVAVFSKRPRALIGEITATPPAAALPSGGGVA